jgi:SAM-dependent methyltransferase
VKDQVRLESAPDRRWHGWCCSYCSGPLDERAHGLFCAAEGRWFATDRGVHRLLPGDRRQEIAPFLELERRVRRDEAELGAALDEDSLRRGLERVAQELGPGTWRVLDAGSRRCQAGAWLAGRGHHVVAVDVSLDAEEGLLAADQYLSDPARLLRAEAEIDALPIEPRAFDLVVAAGSLARVARVGRALVELRRVTRRGGVLLAIGTPVYRRRADGETATVAHLRAQSQRYGAALPRESLTGFLVFEDLGELFRTNGWTLEVHEWPRRVSEWATDAWSMLLRRGRPARYPLLIARRDG